MINTGFVSVIVTGKKITTLAKKETKIKVNWKCMFLFGVTTDQNIYFHHLQHWRGRISKTAQCIPGAMHSESFHIA